MKDYFYMSGALTGLTKEQEKYAKQLYEVVESCCREVGLECYLPHKQSDPSKPFAHTKIWTMDFEKVMNSIGVIAYVGIPSIGVGIEIEMAWEAHHDVIIACEEKNVEKLSRLVLGHDVVKGQVIFSDLDELPRKLKPELEKIANLYLLDKLASELNWSWKSVKETERAFVSTQATRGKSKGLLSREDIIGVHDAIEKGKLDLFGSTE